MMVMAFDSSFWSFLVFFGLQRDTLQAATSFAQRNQLPVRLQDQMVAHLSLRYRTDSEGLQQQEILDVLPKAIRSSISHYLFYSLVDKVYLFQGVSNDLLFQLVIVCISSSFYALYFYAVWEQGVYSFTVVSHRNKTFAFALMSVFSFNPFKIT